ncbi:response regulator transcription factor [Conexibacter stalactiti]|uniref:Response regulator transcription factor n=1 Tax=Conexibacter stalactiti TaxID=1940611 RepID=A0ABU4HIR4_9ACTN|nr:response regulator transcription factor [Conexibacter stalactiti]MDW5593207.1 response regulator transcription factor [Conexibacter stalactiti]MEC5033848.1 response regulator transcription factor [Conexibacter stalactiti]
MTTALSRSVHDSVTRLSPIHRILCRVSRPEPRERLRAGALEVQPAGYTARADGRVIPLTPREFELLTALMRRPDEVLSRELLYRLCWGQEMSPSDRAVDVYVRKLRAKLDRALPEWMFIHTHYRLGYRFSPQRLASDDATEDNRSVAKGRVG